MFGTHDLALFIVSGLLLNMAPGPDSLLVMTRSASHGFRAGSAAAFGIGAGTFVHIFAAALGLSAVIATSVTAFAVVKWVGAAYLILIGLSMLRSRATPVDAPAVKTAASPEPASPDTLAALRLPRIFLQGFLTNVLNPKVAIFFLAFVPQFIDTQAPNKALAFIVLGCIFNVNGMLWLHALALTSAFAGRRLRSSAWIGRCLNPVIGSLFVALGVKLALAERT